MSISDRYKPQPRDNEYYEGLLKRKAPRIYKDWKADKFQNLRQALVAAKIKRETTGFDVLCRGWNKATPDEKKAFLKMMHREDLAEMAERDPDLFALLDNLDMSETE